MFIKIKFLKLSKNTDKIPKNFQIKQMLYKIDFTLFN